jgi:anti-sigma factor RsiW
MLNQRDEERFLNRELKSESRELSGAMITAYLDGELDAKDRKYVENLIAANGSNLKKFEKESKKRDLISQMIPIIRLSTSASQRLASELHKTSENILEQQKPSLKDKIWNFLNKDLF